MQKTYESALIFLVHPRRLRRLARWRWWCKVGYAHFAPPSPTGLSRFSGVPGLRGNVSLAPEQSGMTHRGSCSREQDFAMALVRFASQLTKAGGSFIILINIVNHRWFI